MSTEREGLPVPTEATAPGSRTGSAYGGPPRTRRRWIAAALAAVALTGVVAAFGDDLVAAAHEVGRRLTGGGRLYWSDGESAWTEIPLALSLRRHWGPTDAVITPKWTEAAGGLSIGDLTFLRPPDPRAVNVVLARIDPAKWRFRVWGRADWSRAPVATLADEAGLALAVNGPYFAEDGPLGLVVSDSVTRNREGTRRAAHFVVEGGRPRIINEREPDLHGIEQGFQGFPAIMSDRRTFAYLRTGGRGFDVRQVDRRTAACLTAEGRVILLVTDTWTSGLSLAELATVMGALGCVDAMAFDGGASTALWVDLPGVRRDVDGLDTVPVVLGVAAR